MITVKRSYIRHTPYVLFFFVFGIWMLFLIQEHGFESITKTYNYVECDSYTPCINVFALCYQNPQEARIDYDCTEATYFCQESPQLCDNTFTLSPHQVLGGKPPESIVAWLSGMLWYIIAWILYDILFSLGPRFHWFNNLIRIK